jgi:uncharacterized protein DUF3987
MLAGADDPEISRPICEGIGSWRRIMTGQQAHVSAHDILPWPRANFAMRSRLMPPSIRSGATSRIRRRSMAFWKLRNSATCLLMTRIAKTARVPTGNGRANAGDTWPEPDMRLVTDDRMPVPALDDDGNPGSRRRLRREPAARLHRGLADRRGIRMDRQCASRRVDRRLDRAGAPVDGVDRRPEHRKTPALQPITDASRALEREAEPAWHRAMAQHDRDAEAAKARDKAWRDTVRDAAANGAARPARPADAEQPVPPPRPRVIAMDTSTEELQRMLAETPRGLLYLRDELAGWLGSFDRYNGNGADRAFFFGIIPLTHVLPIVRP